MWQHTGRLGGICSRIAQHILRSNTACIRCTSYNPGHTVFLGSMAYVIYLSSVMQAESFLSSHLTGMWFERNHNYQERSRSEYGYKAQ